MWKEFFFFNRTQRIGIIVLIFILIIMLIINLLAPTLFKGETNFGKYENADYKEFYSTLMSRDSLRNAERETQYNNWQNSFGNNNYARNNYNKKATNEYSLFKFDPNTADSATFVKLGIRPYIASNILKFRTKGGRFRTVESFAKTYGLSEEKFEELKPYISIETIDATIAKTDSLKQNNEKATKTFIGTLDLNTADTTSLMQIKGIGRGYARAIVRFRALAGGYVDKQQLLELPHMTEEKYKSIESFFSVDKSLVQQINVNIASVDRLKAHPYLNFYQAKALYELRRKKGKLRNIEELKQIEEFDHQTINKIQPYLKFEN
jgi:competence protein ComEA